jgi:DNA-binding response OmpR family regulator
MPAKKKILIVDDDPDILDALNLTFTFSNFETQTTTRGEEVPDLVENVHPQVIILDIMLSGIDGTDICKKLKSNELTKNIPVIMISAHPDGATSSLNAGADGFVAKPFDIFVLIDKVEELSKH